MPCPDTQIGATDVSALADHIPLQACAADLHNHWCYALFCTTPFHCHTCNAATCILFGDGTGAMVLTAQQGQCSLLGIDSHSDGSGQKHLNVSLPFAM